MHSITLIVIIMLMLKICSFFTGKWWRCILDPYRKRGSRVNAVVPRATRPYRRTILCFAWGIQVTPVKAGYNSTVFKREWWHHRKIFMYIVYQCYYRKRVGQINQLILFSSLVITSNVLSWFKLDKPQNICFSGFWIYNLIIKVTYVSTVVMCMQFTYCKYTFLHRSDKITSWNLILFAGKLIQYSLSMTEESILRGFLILDRRRSR